MKQYRITTENLLKSESDDCYLSPDDPIQELIACQALDGLGSQQRLDELRSETYIDISNNKGQIQREQNIKPGTPEWFKLWFGK